MVVKTFVLQIDSVFKTQELGVWLISSLEAVHLKTLMPDGAGRVGVKAMENKSTLSLSCGSLCLPWTGLFRFCLQNKAVPVYPRPTDLPISGMSVIEYVISSIPLTSFLGTCLGFYFYFQNFIYLVNRLINVKNNCTSTTFPVFVVICLWLIGVILLLWCQNGSFFCFFFRVFFLCVFFFL